LGFCTLTDVWRSFLARFSCRLRLARADGTPVRVRGSVVSLDGSKLIVRAKDGKDVSVSLADNFAALAVVKSSTADIKEGTFIGTATVTHLAISGSRCILG
jgi:hypothetical protein